MTPIRAALAPAVAVMALTAAVVSLPARAQAPADPLPEGPGKALVASACTVCHQVDVVTAQHHTGAEWDDIIGKMIDRGATLTDAERGQVHDYLTTNFGDGAPAAAPAAPAPEAAPSAPPAPPTPPKS